MVKKVYFVVIVIGILVAGVAAAGAVARSPHRRPAVKVLKSKSGDPTSAYVWHFKVPSSDKGFRVKWSFNCAAEGGEGRSWFNVYAQGGAEILKGPNYSGKSKSGLSTVRKTGAVFIEVSSSCHWKLQILKGA